MGTAGKQAEFIGKWKYGSKCMFNKYCLKVFMKNERRHPKEAEAEWSNEQKGRMVKSGRHIRYRMYIGVFRIGHGKRERESPETERDTDTNGGFPAERVANRNSQTDPDRNRATIHNPQSTNRRLVTGAGFEPVIKRYTALVGLGAMVDQSTLAITLSPVETDVQAMTASP